MVKREAQKSTNNYFGTEGVSSMEELTRQRSSIITVFI
jgi:hypothetical protein